MPAAPLTIVGVSTASTTASFLESVQAFTWEPVGVTFEPQALNWQPAHSGACGVVALTDGAMPLSEKHVGGRPPPCAGS